MSAKKRLELLGNGDVCKLLKISPQRFHFLVRKYKIPHYKTSSGKIYLKESIVKFQRARKDRLKHKAKK